MSRRVSFAVSFALAALLLVPVASAQTPSVTADPALAHRYAETITPAELAGHLYLYASDAFEGRDTGAPGQRLAALYLSGQYQVMGIQPKGTATPHAPYAPDAYRQPFMLERPALARLSVTARRGSAVVAQSLLAPDALDEARIVPVYGQMTSGDAPVVYAGYASADDLSALGEAVRGAYVLALPGTRENPDDQRATFGKLRAAAAAGARGLLVATDAPNAAALRGQAEAALRGGRLALPSADSGAPSMPAIALVTADVVDALLAGAGGASLRTSATPTDLKTTLSVDAETTTEQVETENVIAYVEGSDPVLKDEFVIVSAHLDHVGTRDEGEDRIFNGADDDGSGTVSLLEIAEAFQTAKNEGHGPRRSVLFLHVTGEEKGLLGSEYYADVDPVVPLANTVANLNIDMIGRVDPTDPGPGEDYVYIIGGDLISQDISDWNAAVNDALDTGIRLSDRFNSPDDPNQFFRRSDHWNFGKHQIPFIFYFTGTHEDYHKVGDEPEKILYDRMARIARLVFGTAWEIANTTERPAVSGTGFN